jgi:predicted RecB family endonuclease
MIDSVNRISLADLPRRRDGNREARLQAEIVAWLRSTLPNFVVFAIWNGGDLISKVQAAKRKWLGVLAGVADVVVVAPGKTLFVEIKAGSSVSPAQREFGVRVNALGHHWIVARSIDDVRRALTAVGIEF